MRTTILLFALLPASVRAAEPKPQFAAVAKVLIKNCIRCHYPNDKHNDLNMATRTALLKGGDNGPGINLKEPTQSLIIKRAENGSMPPINDGPQVPAADVKLLLAWVKAGAHWPESATLTPKGVQQAAKPIAAKRRARIFRRRFRLRRLRRCR